MWPSGGHIQQTSQSKHEECQIHLYLAKLMQRVLQHEWSWVGPARTFCPAVGGCITSYTKERLGPNSSRGADTENGHTLPPKNTKRILWLLTLQIPSPNNGVFHWGRGPCRTAKALHKACLCARVHAPGRHWRGCYGCRVEKASRVSFPLSGLLSQVVFN